MKLESQCCTLQQAKRLKELEVVQQSVACYIDDELHLFEKSAYNWAEQNNINAVAAYTLSELMRLLPERVDNASLTIHIDEYGDEVHYCVGYMTGDMRHREDWHMACGRDSLINAAVDMLIMMLETGRLTPDEVNQWLLNA